MAKLTGPILPSSPSSNIYKLTTEKGDNARRERERQKRESVCVLERKRGREREESEKERAYSVHKSLLQSSNVFGLHYNEEREKRVKKLLRIQGLCTGCSHHIRHLSYIWLFCLCHLLKVVILTSYIRFNFGNELNTLYIYR